MVILAVYVGDAEQGNFYSYGRVVKIPQSYWIKIIKAIQELTGDKFNLTSKLVLLNDTRFWVKRKNSEMVGNLLTAAEMIIAMDWDRMNVPSVEDWLQKF